MQRTPEAVLLMVVREDHIQEVVFLGVLDPVCVYTFISVEIKTWTIDFEESQYWWWSRPRLKL